MAKGHRLIRIALNSAMAPKLPTLHAVLGSFNRLSKNSDRDSSGSTAPLRPHGRYYSTSIARDPMGRRSRWPPDFVRPVSACLTARRGAPEPFSLALREVIEAAFACVSASLAGAICGCPQSPDQPDRASDVALRALPSGR